MTTRKTIALTRWTFADKVISLLFNMLCRLVITFLPRSSSVQFSSVAQSCLILCDPMNCSTPGFPVHHQFLEFTQTHVHRVGDTIQPSHPFSSCPQSLLASEPLPMSQLFASGGQSIRVSALASFLPKNTQD